jgi:hypothetical protein
MQSTTRNLGRRQYTTPQLAVHGTLEEVTQQLEPNKQVGPTDGFTFQGIDISNIS